jgi:hypothetical protein
MNTTAVKHIAVWWIVPALVGAGIAMVSFVAATWDCQIPGCTHWFREALAFPTRCCTGFVLETVGVFLGFESAVPFALASIPLLGIATGVLLARGVCCLMTRARCSGSATRTTAFLD